MLEPSQISPYQRCSNIGSTNSVLCATGIVSMLSLSRTAQPKYISVVNRWNLHLPSPTGSGPSAESTKAYCRRLSPVTTAPPDAYDLPSVTVQGVHGQEERGAVLHRDQQAAVLLARQRDEGVDRVVAYLLHGPLVRVRLVREVVQEHPRGAVDAILRAVDGPVVVRCVCTYLSTCLFAVSEIES